MSQSKAYFRNRYIVVFLFACATTGLSTSPPDVDISDRPRPSVNGGPNLTDGNSPNLNKQDLLGLHGSSLSTQLPVLSPKTSSESIQTVRNPLNNSSPIIDLKKTEVPEIFRAQSKPRPSPSSTPMLPNVMPFLNLSREAATRTVPSEGGELLGPLSSSSTVINKSANLDPPVNTNMDKGGSLAKLLTREGVSSYQTKSSNYDESTHLLYTSNPHTTEVEHLPIKETSDSPALSRPTSNIPSLNTAHQPRPGTEPPKIFPRKGVLDQYSSEQTSSEGIENHYNQQKLNSSVINSEMLNSDGSHLQPTEKSSQPVPSSIYSTQNPNLKNISLNILPTLPLLDSKNITSEQHPMVDKSGIVASYPPLKKKLKPLKTTDTDSFSNLPVITEHSSSGHDYVIPIVVTILTVPMLVVVVLFLYKKGSEFWERRHYRRMDFLIDGMYND